MTAGGETAAAAAPLVVRARRVDGAPVVAVRVWIRGGSRIEPAPGLALVAGRMLAEGTARRDWRRIAREAEDLGLSVSTSAGYEVQSIALDGLAADWRQALEWAAELTLEPVFPAARCQWVSEQTREELDSLADHPDVVAEWAFRRQLYAPHARSRPLQGTAESLATIDGEACASLHRRALGRGVIVTVAGAIDPAAAKRLASDLFAPLAVARPAGATDPPAAIRGLDRRQEVTLASGEQAHLFLGALTVRRGDPALPALELLSVALGAGGGLIGRIPGRVREAEGLAYVCRTATAAGAGLEPGRCEVYLATSPRRVARAETAVRQELERLVAEPFPEAELEDARSYLLGAEPFRRETARQWADLLAEAAFYGVPVDRPDWLRRLIRAVEVEDVERAARRFLDPSRLRLTLAMR